MICNITQNIYSGIAHLNPNIELNEAASKELYELINKTTIVPKTYEEYKGHFHGLGPRSFIIGFENIIDDNIYYVLSTPKTLYKHYSDNTMLYFFDTENINDYLIELFNAIKFEI